MRGYPYILNRDQFHIMRAMVRDVLEHPLEAGRKWTLQGFGMMRLYLSPTMRLHVWSKEHVVSGVSDVHDHPWHFSSFVLSGEILNVRYDEIPARTNRGAPIEANRPNYHKRTIRCGPGGCAMDDVSDVCLVAGTTEIVPAGHAYGQQAHELHSSRPSHGAVSIIVRQPAAGRDPDLANVCYPIGTEWVSAEPRPAKPSEVIDIRNAALARWDSL